MKKLIPTFNWQYVTVHQNGTITIPKKLRDKLVPDKSHPYINFVPTKNGIELRPDIPKTKSKKSNC